MDKNCIIFCGIHVREVKAFRELRLWLIKETIGNQPIILCIDETEDEKKDQATDYVGKQYLLDFIGNSLA